MITITLLHPQNATPVQNWTFETESVVRVGRATDNQVVLYSAVVSRYHAELHAARGQWQLVNLGANGTYIDGQPITESISVVNGTVIRLAKSGPQLQIKLLP
ncbi:FHA domain-containing protein [Chroococcidiopsis sp. FACHB-1243]|uniref:FHA domain-containing protein n=1 Tax=Chroococcidiopsis sp. [FACHB-1243] TaxID=2692781 RepID=UPI001786180D|nr:FHA domain-containing protein [Chroococcidiopsis sp. [FACHB-1243]]